MSSNHKGYGYGKGERDGSNGKYDPPNGILDDLFTWSEDGMKRMNEENDWYDKGYVHGKGQKDSNNGHYDSDYTDSKGYNEGWSNGSSGDNGSGGGCFLTTACTVFRGLPDNCNQLETLRKFRDGYVKKQPNGKELINEYYLKAPQVVRMIETMDTTVQEKVYGIIFDHINYACYLIRKNRNDEAFVVYAETSRKMYSVFSSNLL